MSKVEHTCPFCGSKAKRWPSAIAENPFCAGCLHERMALSCAPRCPTCQETMTPILSQAGHYVHCNNVVELHVVWKQLDTEYAQPFRFEVQAPVFGDMIAALAARWHRELWQQLERFIARAGVEKVKEIRCIEGSGDRRRWEVIGKADENFGVVEMRFVGESIEFTMHDPFGPELA